MTTPVCRACGRSLSIGSPLFSDRRPVAAGDGLASGFLYGDCIEAARTPEHRRTSLTSEMGTVALEGITVGAGLRFP